MNRPDLRAEPRVAVTCAGTLTVGGVSAECVIQNMCSRGFLIRAEKELPVGHNVQLRLYLYPNEAVECTVQVRHVTRQCLGAKVIEISEAGRHLCLRFLEEQRAAQLAVEAI